jgi:uncharacterized membrane protein YdcZ (DUF606 family)
MGSALLLAAAIGIAIGVQVSILGRAAGKFDALTVSMVLQVSGLAAGSVWIAGRAGWGEVLSIARTWWWIPLGLLGWVLVGGLGFVADRAGVTATLALVVAFQLATGLLIDGGVGVKEVSGLALLTVGAVLVVA